MSYSYLALGDSYTIGEAVLLTQSFPYQLVQKLRAKNILFNAPEIIAKTGYTSGELQAAIEQYFFLKQYDLVTLLIGVNNQYRGKSIAEFEIEFEIEFDALLAQAIKFSANKIKNVFVLSIPDWGQTPYAEGRDKAKISTEINAYNAVCKNAAIKHGVHFIDITTAQRADAALTEFVANDGLHPSAKEYEKWAALLDEEISLQIDAG